MSAMSLKEASKQAIEAGLSAESARWLVDYYYSMQDFRIQATGQERAIMQSADEGLDNVVSYLGGQTEALEKEIRSALDRYSDQMPGQWAKSITGIGPVIAAGLMAHIDIEKAPTVGHIWRFAGLDPSVAWDKGEKRPWNAKLKVLCWKIGDSFVKVRNRDSDVYGQVYAARKELELARNDAGAFADQAAATLASKTFRDKAVKAVYESGKLPLGRIELRSRRYATKLFLSHYHHVAFEDRFGTPPPFPYVLDHVKGHQDFIAPPNWPMD